MPELPEVETVVRDLRQTVVGQTITGVHIYWERSIATPTAGEFRAELLGQRIEGADRRGKFIILHLTSGDLLIHLRMTGRLYVAAREGHTDQQHLRVALDLSDSRLLFVDMRKFGRLYRVPDAATVLRSLGVEPLDAEFTPEYLRRVLSRRRSPIKAALLDQRLVAGIGNIYADEALYSARLAPDRPASSLTAGEAEALQRAIQHELERAIQDRGTTFSDYRDGRGRAGEHRRHLHVYGRIGQPCRRCGAPIERMRIAGRGSYHCPCCQK